MTKKKITESSKNRFNFYAPNNIITEQFKTKEANTDNLNASILSSVTDKLGIPHPFDYTEVEKLVTSFGLVNSILVKYCDFAIGPNLNIDSDDEKQKEFLEKWMEDTNFKIYLRPWLFNALLYGPGYLEIADLKNSKKISQIKVVDSKTVYIKKDIYGNIENYNQFLGNDFNRVVSTSDVQELEKDDIIQLTVNKIGTNPYGYGIVRPAMAIINDFLMAQSSLHKLTKRKANTPVHWKMGNVEKDIWPKQGDIEAWGSKLVFMNESTDYVTGPDMEAKVIDYGNIGDKFTAILDNDYLLMSYAFQVPESIMGKGNIAEGMADNQMDGFNRRIKAIQDDITNVIKTKIFNVILIENGFTPKYSIVWDELSDEEENKKLEVCKNLLATVTLSPGLRKEIEKKVAIIMDIDYKEIEKENDKMEVEDETDAETEEKPEEEPMQNEENITEAIKGVYAKEEHIQESEVNENIRVSEWLNTDIKPHTQSIIRAIKDDRFTDLLAENPREEARGYLKVTEINKLKSIFSIAILNNLHLADIKSMLRSNVKIGDLYKYNKVVMSREKRIDMIAKTELTRILNKGILKTHEGTDHVILLKWDATIDERTCPVCASLNNQVFDADTLTQDMVPPIHPNCRCNLDEVKQAKTESIKNILSKNLAPQELEIAALKNGVAEDKAKKFADSFAKLNGNNN